TAAQRARSACRSRVRQTACLWAASTWALSTSVPPAHSCLTRPTPGTAIFSRSVTNRSMMGRGRYVASHLPTPLFPPHARLHDPRPLAAHDGDFAGLGGPAEPRLLGRRGTRVLPQLIGTKDAEGCSDNGGVAPRRARPMDRGLA